MTDEKRHDGEPVNGPSDDSVDQPQATSASDAVSAPGAAAPVDGASAGEASADGIEEDELTVQDILDAADREVAEPSDEHLADLKRVTAEYANYRKRTESNREVERERVVGSVVNGLLPVLDDLDRAEKHGDLEGESAFATIAAKLRASVERLGLSPFGTVGEPFDPEVHEAIFQQPSPEADSETVADVIETGYRLGSTLLRAAKVVVRVPSDG
ncbi:nucleotide exchange factor GrpE [Glaciibacter sp. 2TAF33]|uniref:nucleotide exchange factor GrpE n=1 Tax=Glaciibacter sp. 2TAF33 TaxID=3233015 RepID=UPI003F8E80DF